MGNSIHFILTGGTIEKAYDPLTEKPEFRNESIIPEYLEKIVKAYPLITYEILCQIDSLNMNDDTRTKIAASVEKNKADKIVIAHGTSTMEQTASFLKNHLKENKKTIVLTGAMIPLKEFAMSDGGFNLGFAIAQVSTLDVGIYVCMNAHTFAAGEVSKNTKEGRFVSLF